MLNLTSWCQNVADLHSFPSMYDMYRQHRSNAGENDDWIQKNTQSEQKFWRKKSLFRLLLLANTFYGCLFKTSNQIENGTIDFLFKMHLVWSLEVPKNQKCLEKVTQFSENFVFFRHFILMFLSYFRTKLRKKIIFSTKILCFIYFLCIGIDLVPQKTLISKVQFKFWKNNPGPQADTAS